MRSKFLDDCRNGIDVDAQFCAQVRIGEMTGTGKVLNVPSTLGVFSGDRADAICDQFALLHFEPAGRDLGYQFIHILDENGGVAATCTAGV